MIAIEKVAGTLISNDVRTRILRQQLGTTVAKAQQPGEQGLAVSDRSTHSVASRIVVVGNHRLIALIHVPINVALMMIHPQYRPVFATALHPPLYLLSRLQPRYRLASPVRVCASIDRVLQYAEYGVVSGGLPDHLARVF